MRSRLLLAFALLLAVFQVADAQTRHVATVLVDFPDSQPFYSPEQILEWTRQDMSATDAFYAEQSYGAFTVQSDVFGIFRVDLTQEATKADIAAAAQAALAASGVDTSLYSDWVYVSPTTNSVGGGYGDLSGVWIARLPTEVASPGFDTAAHELGHHFFGLLHAKGSSSGQGDTLDIMGSGRGHFNALIKARLGWLSDAGLYRLRTVTQSGDYLIEPYESATAGVKALMVQAFARKVPGTKYYFEYRQPIGFDAYQPWAAPDNVFHGALVHTPDIFTTASVLAAFNPNDGPYPNVINRPALTVGQSFCNSDGRLRVTVLSESAAGLLVRIELGRCR